MIYAEGSVVCDQRIFSDKIKVILLKVYLFGGNNIK